MTENQEKAMSLLPNFSKGDYWILILPLVLLIVLLAVFVAVMGFCFVSYPEIALYLKTGNQTTLFLEAPLIRIWGGTIAGVVVVCMLYQIFLSFVYIRYRHLINKLKEK